MSRLDIDFTNLTVESLRDLLPKDETADWEWKSAQLFEPSKREDFDKKLSRALSAFANTGGGYYILGLEDSTKEARKCPDKIGRATTTSWLDQKIGELTSFPIQGVKIHRVPFSGNLAEAIYVLEIPDSDNAPHLSNTEHKYMWRLGGSTKPAPHFHVDNLFRRVTVAVISSKIGIHSVRGEDIDRGFAIRVQFSLTVANESRSIAKPCACRIVFPQDKAWFFPGSPGLTCEYLFPHDQIASIVDAYCVIGTATEHVYGPGASPSRRSANILRGVRLQCVCYSHNYHGAGEELCARELFTADQITSCVGSISDSHWWKPWDFQDEVRKLWQ